MSEHNPEIGYAAIAQVEAYWEAIRGGRLLPRRSDIDPRGIEQALEHAFILERIAPGVARLRLAGNRLTTLIGMETKGMPLTSFFTPAARHVVADLLEVVFQTPAAATLSLTATSAYGQPALEGRLVLLPLESDLGDVSRALGCLVWKGDLGRAPRRFDIKARQITKITPGTPGTPHPNTPRTRPSPAAPVGVGMSEDAASFDRQGASKRRPPYLRLVKSDD